MTLSHSKESTDSPWYDLIIEIHKVSTLDTPNQPLTRSKKLGDSQYDTFKCFCKTKNIIMLVGCF